MKTQKPQKELSDVYHTMKKDRLKLNKKEKLVLSLRRKAYTAKIKLPKEVR